MVIIFLVIPRALTLSKNQALNYVVGFMMQTRKQSVVICKRCRCDASSDPEDFSLSLLRAGKPLCGDHTNTCLLKRSWQFENHRYLSSPPFP